MDRRNFIKNTSLIGVSSILFNPFSSYAVNQIGLERSEETRIDIKNNRTTEAEVCLLDINGKPLKNKTVEVELMKHEFLFGDCNKNMDALFRLGSGGEEELRIGRKVFSEVLNALNVTCYWTERPRNNMAKTEEYQGEVNLNGFDESVRWGLSEGLTIKGHPLFWPVPKAIPEWLDKYDYQTQLKFLEIRLRSIVSRYKGKVKLYDAVNEMLWEPALKNLKKRTWPYMETIDNIVEYVSFVLKICREEDPDARFLLNDYGLERNHNQPVQLAANDNDVSAIQYNKLIGNDGKEVTALRQRERYLELVARLSDRGFTPSAIGMQGHSGAVTREEQWALYDQMYKLGIPLHITEFWAHKEDFGKDFQVMSQTDQQEYLSEYVVNYMKNAFAHPAIGAFFFWGFMDMAVQFTEGLSRSYELLPLYYKVKDLIHKEWHTKELLTTNSDGKIHFRGYYGDYSMRYATKDSAALSIGMPFKLSKFQDNRFVMKTLI
jgi:endo-1,4-beta-xylanase